MPRKDKHLTKKGVITILVVCLCALAIYLIWGRGSLYLLQPKADSKPKHKKQSVQEDESRQAPEDLMRLCMLNAGKCQVIFTKTNHSTQEQEQIRVFVQAIPSNIVSMESVVFRVEGADFTSLSGSIVGLNMDMGETIVRFHKVDDELYEGRAIMASCTEETMQYRMRLSSEDTDSATSVDFDAKRKVATRLKR